jgi:hypothetical protein
MNSIEVTTTTTSLNGFTVTSNPRQWAIVRPATAEEAADLSMDLRLSDFEGLTFTSVDSIVQAVECIQLSTLSPSRKFDAYVPLFCSGLLVANYADDDREDERSRVRIDSFYYTEGEEFLLACENLLGETQEPRVRRMLFRLWACTAEAKTQPPSLDLIRQWVRFFLTQENAKYRKWSPVLKKRSIEGLRALATKVLVREAHFKYSPVKKALLDVADSEFFPIWEKGYSDWVESRHYADVTKANEAFTYLQRYFSDQPHLLDPENFFNAQLARESLLEWASKPELKPSNARKLLLINQFIRAFVATRPFMAIRDEFEDGEIFLREGYNWPLTNTDLTTISDVIGENQGNYKSNHKSLPEHLLRRIEQILVEDDMKWPKQRSQDWIDVLQPGGATARVYCPVLPLLTRTLLRLPLRPVQARRLDSGEGDELNFDLNTRAFVPNSSVHAGYWARKPEVQNPQRGVLRRFFDSSVQKAFCGFYINSNKTRDRKVLFDENSGYEISWEFDEVIEIFQEMREWQEQNNPVQGPIEFNDLPPAVFAEPSESVKSRKVACFYLFRFPCGYMATKASPPTMQVLRTFWYECLAELERRLATEMDNPPKLIDNWDGKTPSSSQYHIYGLRIGGITRLAKTGVSPWILQNIVAGHMSWVMTAGYIDLNFGFITAHLTEHYVKAMQTAQGEFAHFLTEATVENVHKRALFNGERALNDLLSTRKGKSSHLMATLDIGMCPNCQTRCDEGYSVIQWLGEKPKEFRNTFGPVPLLPTGRRDCGRCDFLIPGTPFMDGTAVRCNEISVYLSESTDRQRDLLRSIDSLEAQRVKASRSGQKLSPSDAQALQSRRLEYKQESDNMVELAISLDANLKRLQEIMALACRLRDEGGSEIALVVNNQPPEFKWELIHRFEAVDELCRAAEWFKSVKVEPLRNERIVSILKIFAREGMTPPFALLDEASSNDGIDALTALVRRRLNRQSVAALVDGHETFHSLGLLEDVEQSLEKISKPQLRPISEVIETQLKSSFPVAESSKKATRKAS